MDRKPLRPLCPRRRRRTPLETSAPVPATVMETHFSELAAMAKGVIEESGKHEDLGTETSSLFERGRLYEFYSARRDERLKKKKKKRETEMAEENIAQDPLVAVELAKRRNWKKAEGVRKSVPGSSRSRKEMKKVPGLACAEKASVSSRKLARRL